MSLDYNFYVGPYLKCQYHLVDSPRQIFTCSNSICQSYGKDLEHTKYKFCPVCGSKLEGSQIIKRKPNVDTRELAEQIEEKLYAADVKPDGNYHYWISNIDDTPGVHLSQEFDTLVIPLVTDDWIQRFGEILSNEIASIKKVYDKVEIEIGVLFWRD